MKATVDVPDELYRRVKAKSALEGRPIRAVVIELLADWLEGRSGPGRSAGAETKTREQGSTPTWFGSLSRYGSPGVSHQMDDIRASIESGLRKQRKQRKRRPGGS